MLASFQLSLLKAREKQRRAKKQNMFFSVSLCKSMRERDISNLKNHQNLTLNFQNVVVEAGGEGSDVEAPAIDVEKN